MMALTECFH